jgi:flagellar protein FliS
MYAASPFRSPAATPLAAMYRQVGTSSEIDHASPHRLVTMLYDGLLESVAQARGALTNRDIDAKGRAVGRAVRIVEEGLRGGLNRQQGGELAGNLDALYAYVARRLTEANLRNDDQALAECAELVKPLRDAWLLIGKPDAPTPHA